MKILIVSATTQEINPLLQYLENKWQKLNFSEFTKPGYSVSSLVTGVGSMMMAFALARSKKSIESDLILHIGLSGAYKPDFRLTEVVEVISEEWGDLGAEASNGNFLDVFHLGFLEKDRYPYAEGKILKIKDTIHTGLKQVTGLTVNKTSGTHATIDRLKHKFHADVESMEGAGLFYACRVMDLPFISIRAISNFVEPRDKSKWKVEEAIVNLNIAAIQLIESLKMIS